MTFFISPSVTYSETDATLGVVQDASDIGGLAGTFNWGPVDKPFQITGGEDELKLRFGPPTDDNYLSFLVAADFFSYSPSAWIVRKVGDAAKNAVTGSNTAVLVKNEDELETASLAGIDFLGRYPGTRVNGLVIDIADAAKFANWEYRTSFDYTPQAGEFAIAVIDGVGTISGSGGIKQVERLTVTGTASGAGNITVFGKTVAVTNGDTAAQVATKIATALNGLATPIFGTAVPTGATVQYPSLTNGQKAVQATPADQLGLSFAVEIVTTGRLGTLLEKYELMQSVSSAKFPDGSTAYFKDAINNNSQYIFVGDETVALSARTAVLANGADDNADVNLTSAIQELVNAEQYDVNYLIAGAIPAAQQKAVFDVADTRRDLIGFASPEFADVVGNKGNELAAVLDWRKVQLNRESSYMCLDNNWALVYDKYNDKNRWIPTCGGTAGLKARTDRDQDPWISPAGYERGRYKNYIKLAWSPNQTQRDELYKEAINPVVSFPGDGIVLFGDKTAMTRPSSFGYLNVRSSFIVAEKSIANFAKYFLFEINDAYTRAQFLNAVRPFLRNMQARRAFEDVLVICDETNNDGATRQAKKMVGSIWAKPTNSINYVVLQFNAVRSDVSFDEVQAGSTITA